MAPWRLGVNPGGPGFWRHAKAQKREDAWVEGACGRARWPQRAAWLRGICRVATNDVSRGFQPTVMCMNIFGVTSATAENHNGKHGSSNLQIERSLTRREPLVNRIPWVETHGYDEKSLTRHRVNRLKADQVLSFKC